jgi:hypothetical protein
MANTAQHEWLESGILGNVCGAQLAARHVNGLIFVTFRIGAFENATTGSFLVFMFSAGPLSRAFWLLKL